MAKKKTPKKKKALRGLNPDFTFMDDLRGVLRFNDENVISIYLNTTSEDFTVTKTDDTTGTSKTVINQLLALNREYEWLTW